MTTIQLLREEKKKPKYTTKGPANLAPSKDGWQHHRHSQGSSVHHRAPQPRLYAPSLYVCMYLLLCSGESKEGPANPLKPGVHSLIRRRMIVSCGGDGDRTSLPTVVAVTAPLERPLSSSSPIGPV